jgi:hypothetical protein
LASDIEAVAIDVTGGMADAEAVGKPPTHRPEKVSAWGGGIPNDRGIGLHRTLGEDLRSTTRPAPQRETAF